MQEIPILISFFIFRLKIVIELNGSSDVIKINFILIQYMIRELNDICLLTNMACFIPFADSTSERNPPALLRRRSISTSICHAVLVVVVVVIVVVVSVVVVAVVFLPPPPSSSVNTVYQFSNSNKGSKDLYQHSNCISKLEIIV